MAGVQDDKGQHVIPFILKNLKEFQSAGHPASQPFFIGLNGVQGAGKSVLVSILHDVLTSPPYNLPTVVFSLDDLYLTHADQVALAQSHPDNPLLQHRGQPGTHDIALGLEVFRSLKEGRPTRIPQYDKAAFQGQGDRVPDSEWVQVNSEDDDPDGKIKVVLFEGWCVGFRALSDDELRAKHEAAVTAAATADAGVVYALEKTAGTSTATEPAYAGRLGYIALPSARQVNDFLKGYDALIDQLDAFVHLDAADPLYVYRWRLQQEEGLRAKKGSGMTDEQVRHFVDGYYPAYELYTDNLRRGVLKRSGTSGGRTCTQDRPGQQLRFVVDANRQVMEVITI